DVGLADGLAAGDRQRVICVGLVAVVGRHEIFARHFIERTQDGRIGNAALAHLELELHASHAFVARRAGHDVQGPESRTRSYAITMKFRIGCNPPCRVAHGAVKGLTPCVDYRAPCPRCRSDRVGIALESYSRVEVASERNAHPTNYDNISASLVRNG